MRPLRALPLSAPAFAPFGEVIEASGASLAINDGSTQHFADLARIDVSSDGGRARVGIYRAQPRMFPFEVRMLERHPLGSQLFMPLEQHRFLVVVALPGDRMDAASIRAFLSDGRQGVNYHRGTWHHPLLALGRECGFLVVDRAGAGANCDELTLSEPLLLDPR